jgi:hypothetical protein
MVDDVAGIVGGRDRVDLYVAGHPEHLTGPFVSVCLSAGLQRCSNWNPFENFEERQNAANLCVFARLQLASQASHVCSIPIVRENNPCSFVRISFHVPFVPIGRGEWLQHCRNTGFRN